MTDWQVITGDCLEVMPTLEANSVDTILTDPPYGLSFMGKDWDHGVPGVHFWIEAMRVAKPGALLLAFGGTRTFHRLVVAIEDAGWEIRDTIMWIYGSGFPKSHDISKAIDSKDYHKAGSQGGERGRDKTSGVFQYRDSDRPERAAPATPAAQEWHGYGTALKPAFEPIIVAMKPLDGTFAQNAQRWGVAGMWIDGGRVEGTKPQVTRGASSFQKYHDGRLSDAPNIGRWPANVIHDGSDEVLAGFPVTTQNGYRINPSTNKTTWFGAKDGGHIEGERGYSDTGSAARFFYTAKASRAERNAGDVDNGHPTVKPLALMRYLARLTKTPTGGVILDPFAGSGSTGCAAIMEGRSFIGIEISEEYADIARRRCETAAAQARQLELL